LPALDRTDGDGGQKDDKTPVNDLLNWPSYADPGADRRRAVGDRGRETGKNVTGETATDWAVAWLELVWMSITITKANKRLHL
jgi:hypothetical protein